MGAVQKDSSTDELLRWIWPRGISLSDKSGLFSIGPGYSNFSSGSVAAAVPDTRAGAGTIQSSDLGYCHANRWTWPGRSLSSHCRLTGRAPRTDYRTLGHLTERPLVTSQSAQIHDRPRDPILVFHYNIATAELSPAAICVDRDLTASQIHGSELETRLDLIPLFCFFFAIR
ncbi:hypothetical protein RRG08_008279 [Elysia crispata]|uniref:Uncharacterized protein n=1 Tax=Elysia crispata TaxID=231223 RepID=A0AAE0ZNE1_9GAST|nr:hypothetical protein RRG08_008279 [Elysia crispata]